MSIKLCRCPYLVHVCVHVHVCVCAQVCVCIPFLVRVHVHVPVRDCDLKKGWCSTCDGVPLKFKKKMFTVINIYVLYIKI
jgi:hypothetical protein